jgi:aminoglycoside phosphotransferase (APT) family kinase protein
MPGEVDLQELAQRATAAAQTWAPGCAVEGVEPLTGGSSSLTFTCRVRGGPAGAERLVLKVAPPGLEPVRNRDVARQARLLRALDGAPGVRVPKILFEDDGAPPDIPPFHAMNLVAGECLEPLLTAPAPDVFPLVPDRALDAARVLAALHRFDPAKLGFADEKHTTLADEIARWSKAFSTVDDRMNARYLEAEALLYETMPPELPHVICHGDYRLGNMLCDGGAVNAVIDWEIWALSDPRHDLAWFLFFTEDANHPMRGNPGPTGMPTADALYAAYVEASGAEPADMEWFHCLIRYKEAAATALIFKRIMKADPDRPFPEAIPALTVEAIERLTRLR